jgi:diguanylate cyclase (GGDEF)-like protein
MVFVDTLAVVGIAVVARLLAEQAGGVAGWITFASVTAALVLGFVALPLRLVVQRQRARTAAATRALQAQHARQEFAAGLARALDMADSEQTVLQIAARALDHAASRSDATVMLADSSEAHLQVVASTAGLAPHAGCEVATPGACPAVRNGHTLNFASPDQLDCCPHLVERAAEHGVGLAAVCVPVSVVGRATGVVHAVRVDVPFTDHEQVCVESVARQAGQRVGMLRATRQAQWQASTDPLTGLFNRRSMDEAVRGLVHDQVPFSVAICDLDRFKRLNDTHGHETGDRALRLFALTLRNTVRAGDFVARHGGEEFVVVLPYADARAAADVVDRVRLELAVAVSDGRVPAFTMSAGVADTSEASEYRALLELADARLLEAKRSGRDRVLAVSP